MPIHPKENIASLFGYFSVNLFIDYIICLITPVEHLKILHTVNDKIGGFAGSLVAVRPVLTYVMLCSLLYT